MNKPKWIDHLYKSEFPWKDMDLIEYPNGLFRCPKCNGNMYICEDFDDWDCIKCDICYGTGQVPKRIYRKYKNI